MIREYIDSAMKHAHYELIDDDEPYYGEIPELKGVWASGKSLEECRDNLMENLEGWLLIRNRQGLDIPEIGGYCVTTPRMVEFA